MPHEQLHGASILLNESNVLDALKCKAVENIMPLVTHSLIVAASSDAFVPRKGRPDKPASLHRQIMPHRDHPGLHEGPQSSDGHGKFMIWLWCAKHLTGQSSGDMYRVWHSWKGQSWEKHPGLLLLVLQSGPELKAIGHPIHEFVQQSWY